jgi:hypothetical protein
VARFGRFGEEKNKDVLPLPGIEPQFLVRSAQSLFAVLPRHPKFRISVAGLPIHAVFSTKQSHAV